MESPLIERLGDGFNMSHQKEQVAATIKKPPNKKFQQAVQFRHTKDRLRLPCISACK